MIALINVLSLFFILISCTLAPQLKQKIETSETKQVIRKNEHPTIFEMVKRKDYIDLYKIEIIPQTIIFGCIIRNDYPHYWCDIQAKMKNPAPKLPNIIVAIYMSSRSKMYNKNFERALEKFKKIKKNKVYLLGISSAIISKNGNTDIIFMPFNGLYSKGLCMNWFNDFDNCPDKSKHIYID